MTQKLSEQEVAQVARLGRLTLTDQQAEHFAEQLSQVLSYVSKLSELDVDDVEPMAHAMDVTNVWRDDEPGGTLDNDDVLANAPDPGPPFFKVIKVLGDGPSA